MLEVSNRRWTAKRLLSSLQVDISQTKKLLGWKPPYTMEEQLRKMIHEKQMSI